MMNRRWWFSYELGDWKISVAAGLYKDPFFLFPNVNGFVHREIVSRLRLDECYSLDEDYPEDDDEVNGSYL